MGESPVPQGNDADIELALDQVRRGVSGVVPFLITMLTVAGLIEGAIIGGFISGSNVIVTALICCALGFGLGWPFSAFFVSITSKKGLDIALEGVRQNRIMEGEANRRQFETQLARALEMVDDEDSAFDVIGRAMTNVVPDAPIEMLLADNSHAHLARVVSVSAEGHAGSGCPVDSPSHCAAARRAQTQVFADSEDLDTCPMLRGRERGRCSGVCVPVSIMGNTVGVVHATGPVGEPLDDNAIRSLHALANQAGNRLGMLRIMTETQLQASTDGLTGLINRRSLENRARMLRNDGTEFALVMSDLDHFKLLNDTHGHDTGDRALRVFSETLRHALRTEDVACRYGGEEFVILLPGADVAQTIEAMDRIRDALAHTTGRGDVPSFTASFGIAHSSEAADFEELMHRADQALFAAKDAGRDRVCVDGQFGPLTAVKDAIEA